MFESRKELFAKIASLEADNARLESDLTAAQAAASSAADSAETIAGLNEDLAAAQAEIAAITSAKDGEIASLSASLAAAEAKSSPEAIQAHVTAQIAASGHPPLSVEGNQAPESTKPKVDPSLRGHAKVAAFFAAKGK